MTNDAIDPAGGEDAAGHPSAPAEEEIRLHGVAVPLTPGVVHDKIAEHLRSGRYEQFEIAGLQSQLRPGDRVLDLGACHGLTSCFAARTPGVRAVLAVEASPRVLPHLRDTFARNGVCVDLRHGMVVPGPGGGSATFYLRDKNWNSSAWGRQDVHAEPVSVPTIGFDALMHEFQPTVLSCDIEGGEYDILRSARLDGLRAVIIEWHPKRVGEAAHAEAVARLRAVGFSRVPGIGNAVKHVYERL